MSKSNTCKTRSDRNIRKARKTTRRDHSAIVPLRVSIADMARIIRSDHREGRSDG